MKYPGLCLALFTMCGQTMLESQWEPVVKLDPVHFWGFLRRRTIHKILTGLKNRTEFVSLGKIVNEQISIAYFG